MTPSDIFQFCGERPPSTKEFKAIGDLLVSEFKMLGLGPATVLRMHVEEGSWVNSEVFVGDRHRYEGPSFLAIISYAFRDQKPLATAVLLKFQDGVRVKDGTKAILTSTFAETGWGSLEWQKDLYDEWECDNVNEIPALKR